MLTSLNKELLLTVKIVAIIKDVHMVKSGEVIVKKDVKENNYDLLRVKSINIFEARGIVTISFKHSIVKIFDINQKVCVIEDFDNMIDGAIK